MTQVPGFNIEDIPEEISDSLWKELPINGGNCISIDADSPFGKWLKTQGVIFTKNWEWIVIWR